MRLHVYFEFDGIPGREAFETPHEGIHAYTHALEMFWDLVWELRAQTFEPTTAWQQVLIVNGPRAVAVGP